MVIESIAHPTEATVSVLSERTLAARWNASYRTLQRWRKKGGVPRWFRIGRQILYHVRDIEAFEQTRSTGGPQ